MSHAGHLKAISEILHIIKGFFQGRTLSGVVNKSVIDTLTRKIDEYNGQSHSIDNLVKFTDSLVSESSSLLAEATATIYTKTFNMCARQLSVSAISMQMLPNDMHYHKYVIKKSKKALAEFIMCMGGQHIDQEDACLLLLLGKTLHDAELNFHSEISAATPLHSNVTWAPRGCPPRWPRTPAASPAPAAPGRAPRS